MNKFPDFIEDIFQEVEGDNKSHDVSVFSLSTCQWCKRAKVFLGDRGIKYRYIDVDRIDISEKSKILQFLRETYKPERISYPVVICDDDIVIGYNPNKYEELLKLGGN
ncbi:MAG: glutaredoxin family protein [Promethearchaeota archaeon]